MIAEKAVQQREKGELTFRQGAKDCVPTLLGYISIGLAAGIVGVSSHLSVMEVTLLSALVYAGSPVYHLCADGCQQLDFSYYSHNIYCKLTTLSFERYGSA